MRASRRSYTNFVLMLLLPNCTFSESPTLERYSVISHILWHSHCNLCKSGRQKYYHPAWNSTVGNGRWAKIAATIMRFPRGGAKTLSSLFCLTETLLQISTRIRAKEILHLEMGDVVTWTPAAPQYTSNYATVLTNEYQLLCAFYFWATIS